LQRVSGLVALLAIWLASGAAAAWLTGAATIKDAVIYGMGWQGIFGRFIRPATDPAASHNGPAGPAEPVPSFLALAPPADRGDAQRMFTARETTSPIVTSETIDCTPMMLLAIGVSGIVSVGENAVAFVSDTYR